MGQLLLTCSNCALSQPGSGMMGLQTARQAGRMGRLLLASCSSVACRVWCMQTHCRHMTCQAVAATAGLGRGVVAVAWDILRAGVVFRQVAPMLMSVATACCCGGLFARSSSAAGAVLALIMLISQSCAG